MGPEEQEQVDSGWKLIHRCAFGWMIAAAAMLLTVAMYFHLRWVHQREAFLARQTARLESFITDPQEREQVVEWWNIQQPLAWHDPVVVALVREQPQPCGLFVLVPDNEVLVRSGKYSVHSCYSEILEAKRLFPEEEISAVCWKSPLGASEQTYSAKGFQEVNIGE